jgi:PAS domain S-box-containing protein
MNSELILDAVLNRSTDAIVCIDKEKKITIFNSKAEKLIGVEKKDAIGKNLPDVIKNCGICRVMETGEKEIGELFEENDKFFRVNRYPIKSGGEMRGAVSFFKDVTDFRVMSNKLEEDEIYINIVNTLLDTFNEWMVVVDKDAKIVMMSKAYKRFVKDLHPEGKHVKDVIENTRMEIVLQTGEKEFGDIQQIGDNKMIAMRMPLVKDGEVYGAIGKVVLKDISELDFLNKKLNVLEKEVEYYKNELGKERLAKYSFENIAGISKKINDVKRIAQRATKTNSNVLITGESGTGKELFAHAIHSDSDRCLGPFVKINCAAIPSELLESEFFGYEEGAFTGARKGGKKGKFLLADRGTIFLDEIGDMPLKMQAKVLRVIQEKEIESVGGNKILELDIRVIAATNRDIEEMVDKGTFREDLYYRLNVVRLRLPPLREKKEDIEIIARYLMKKVENRLGVHVEGITPEALKYLVAHDWPGNARELENVIERALNMIESDLMIRPEHLPKKLITKNVSAYNCENGHLKEILADIEKEIIKKTLMEHVGNKNKVARILGISRTCLYSKIEIYHLERYIR